MFFIYSNDYFLLNKQLNKTLKMLNPNNESEIFVFSLIDDSLIEIDKAINTYSMFGENKIIILKECWFVNETRTILHKDFDIDKFINIINKRNPEVKIIMTLNSDKFSKKLKVAKWIEEVCEVVEIKELDENMIRQYISQSFLRQNKTIDEEAIDYIISNVPLDMQIISNEVNKILGVSDHINLGDVKDNLTKYAQSDIFELSDLFINNKINEFIVKYKQFMDINNDCKTLIALLDANLSATRNVMILIQEGNSNSQIAEKLKLNPYRLKMILQNINTNIEELNDKIKMLYMLNKSIITSKFDGKIMPEYEFVKAMKGKN